MTSAFGMLLTILKRSRKRKLHVHITTDGQPRSQETLTPFFNLLRSSSSRWASLTLLGRKKVSVTSAGQTLCPSLHDGFFSLEQVTIEDIDTYDPDGKLRNALVDAPCLRSVSINKPGQLNWPQLTKLELPDRVDIPSILALGLCKNLHTLIIAMPWQLLHFPDDDLVPSLPPIHLDRLQKLRVALDLDPEVSNVPITHWTETRAPIPTIPSIICNALTVPHLSHLELSTSITLNSDIDSIIALIQRSSCKLNSIVIEGMLLMDVTIERLLRAVSCPTITSLSLSGLPIPYLFDAMRDDPDHFLPNLEHLSVTCVPSPAEYVLPPGTIDAVSHLVKSRVGRIQTLGLDNPSNDVVEDLTKNCPHLEIHTNKRGGNTQTATSRDETDSLNQLVLQPVLREKDLNRTYPEEIFKANLLENFQLLKHILTVIEDSEAKSSSKPDSPYRCSELAKLHQQWRSPSSRLRSILSSTPDSDSDCVQIMNRVEVLLQKWGKTLRWDWSQY
ncbi:hypothetical protein V5O48_013045 [Marasmius crinis-equi]|uniref:F-box domain-containing protein n=1 Tax=Marasmius crinis-equi TaxID=585013 RepID=A0ABR3F169_9AGAR